MGRVYKSSRLSDLLFAEPDLITVASRVGLHLGAGDASIAEVCRDRGVDAEFLTFIINGYLGEEREELPEGVIRADVVEYLRRTNDYYRESQLPNIERHFRALMHISQGQESNLSLMLSLFMEVKEELLQRMSDDDNAGYLFERLNDSERDAQIEDQLHDLAGFFIVHLKGEYDSNLCRAVVTAIKTLTKDFRHNRRLRDLMSR